MELCSADGGPGQLGGDGLSNRGPGGPVTAESVRSCVAVGVSFS